MMSVQTFVHRGYYGQVFLNTMSHPAWTLVVPEDGDVRVDGCVQYGHTHDGSSAHVGWAKTNFSSTVDRFIASGELKDRES